MKMSFAKIENSEKQDFNGMNKTLFKRWKMSSATHCEELKKVKSRQGFDIANFFR